MTDYETFLANKAPLVAPSGFADVPPLSPALKPFQSAVTQWALRRGRAAIFAGTGLGKTLMQLEWSRVVADEIGNVLILCPLAVAEQTVAEASKFGIEGVAYAADQASISTDIVITNYERFEKFDIDRFAGIVLDECFAAGTPVDTPFGVMPIENLLSGMYIQNAAGVDRIAAVAKREVFGAVKVKVNSATYICSPNHPWLTELGWRAARDIRTGDRLVATASALRLVCQEIPSGDSGAGDETILQSILLSEMAYEYAGTQSEGPYSRGCRAPRESEISLVARDARGTSHSPKMVGVWPYAGSLRENEGDIKGSSINETRWERSPDDGTPTTYVESFGGCLDTRDSDISWSENPRVSNMLQTRHRPSWSENRNRTGWSQSSISASGRHQEGCEIEFSRVEGVEILELGCPELDKFRNAEGKLYFYDLEGTRHPSFSVGGNLVHNSGIIKANDGKIRTMLTEACRSIPWKLCCSATPAPNDYTELGQHSEFLGVMDAKEMLAMFFVHDGSIRAGGATQGHDGWRMKRHAANDFWRWLASWSVMVRHPRDLGFDEPGYDLPPLNLHQVTVAAEYKPTAGELFPMMANTLSQRIAVRRETAKDRVTRAAEIVMREPKEPWLIWTHLNSEADMIEKLLPDALQVAGKTKPDVKISRLLGFPKGNPLMLVSKGSIAGRGMNYQNCARQIMVGLTDSFEEVYQCIRRSWRFGQTRPVEVYFIASELEGNVVANLKHKELAFEQMLDAMSVHMRDLQKENVLGGRSATVYKEPSVKMEIPAWI
jgi:hypothetical protein